MYSPDAIPLRQIYKPCHQADPSPMYALTGFTATRMKTLVSSVTCLHYNGALTFSSKSAENESVAQEGVGTIRKALRSQTCWGAMDHRQLGLAGSSLSKMECTYQIQLRLLVHLYTKAPFSPRSGGEAFLGVCKVGRLPAASRARGPRDPRARGPLRLYACTAHPPSHPPARTP